MSSNLFGSFALRCATFSPRAAQLLRGAQEAQRRLELAQASLWDVPCADHGALSEARDAEAAEIAFWLEAAQAAPSRTACKRALRAGGRELLDAVQRLRSEDIALCGHLAALFPSRAPREEDVFETDPPPRALAEEMERPQEQEPPWRGDGRLEVIRDVPPGSLWLAEEVGFVRSAMTRVVVGFQTQEEARAWVSARSARIVRRSAAGFTNYTDSSFDVRPVV